MGYPTNIEWADATWNPFGGCSVLSPGCTNCYAMKLAGTRLAHLPLYAGTTSPSKAGPVFNGALTAAPDEHDVWSWPLRWKGAKQPKGGGTRSRIFVGDMADLFHVDRPLHILDRVFAVAASAPQHDFLILTKRAEVMHAYFADDGRRRVPVAMWAPKPLCALPPPTRWPLPNVWLGVSCEDQARADERVPLLLDTRATVRFVSAEPLLGPIDFDGSWLNGVPPIDWIIAGGESGRDARPMHPQWARDIRDQCSAASVPFFFKQWGEFVPHPCGDVWLKPDGSTRAACTGPLRAAGEVTMWRAGKRGAGRPLDGVIHDGRPR